MRCFHPWPILPSDLEPPAARSLSLLFILQEFLASFELLHRAKEQLAHPVELAFLSEQLDSFLVCSVKNPIMQSGGTIDKLCLYCENLVQASKIEGRTLLLVVDEMRNSILHLKAKLIYWKKNFPSYKTIHAEFKELYYRLQQKLCAFFSALSTYLQESRTNENVLIYLVEYRERFNHFLGPRTIEILLSRFFPSGPCELRAAICEGFTRRGFTEFYAEKESFLDAIEWESASCPQSAN